MQSVAGHLPLPAATALVAAGGAVGATLRWLVGTALPTAPTSFPWTTFTVNVVGSLLLALLPALLFAPASTQPWRHAWLTPFLGPGLLGGFTTLSATSEEARTLIAAGAGDVASAYLLGTLAAALVAVHLAALLVGHRRQEERR